ncbi:hypothetical protein YC2023_076353 [Brassica napus]
MAYHSEQNTTQLPTMEAVMEELQDATRQYLSCTDPVEAAARRQRVLTGDARGEMEQAAAAIIEAAKKKLLRNSQVRQDDSNPVTPPPPPPAQGNSLQALLSPDPSAMYTPSNRLAEDLGADPHRSETSLNVLLPGLNIEKENPTRLKSVIVSPDQVKEKESHSP